MVAAVRTGWLVSPLLPEPSRETSPAPSAEPSLDRKLSDALERVGHVQRVQLRKAAAMLGLSPIQAQILVRLVASGEQEAETGMLAAWFDVRQPTVSDAVAALHRKGLVDRVPVAGDRRRFRVQPTESGRRTAGELADWDAGLRQALAGIGDDVKADAFELLVGLVGRMQTAGHLDVARTCTTCHHFRPAAHPGAAAPHHCGLLDIALGPADLRMDCPEHQPAA